MRKRNRSVLFKPLIKVLRCRAISIRNKSRAGDTSPQTDCFLVCTKLWFDSQLHIKQAWWCTPVIQELWRWMEEVQKFKVILGYTESLRASPESL